MAKPIGNTPLPPGVEDTSDEQFDEDEVDSGPSYDDMPGMGDNDDWVGTDLDQDLTPEERAKLGPGRGKITSIRGQKPVYVGEYTGKYTAKTQPRDASGRFRDVLARLKIDLGDVGSAGALNKIREAENFDYVGDYGKAAEAATDLIGIIDRLDTGALNADSISNVREGARQLGKTIASLPFNFGEQAEKLRYSDLPPALRDLIEDMIKKVEAKIGPEDADIATKDLKSFMSGIDVYSQSDVSSQMSKLLRLLT